jgi:hypothetical protein
VQLFGEYNPDGVIFVSENPDGATFGDRKSWRAIFVDKCIRTMQLCGGKK